MELTTGLFFIPNPGTPIFLRVLFSNFGQEEQVVSFVVDQSVNGEKERVFSAELRVAGMKGVVQMVPDLAGKQVEVTIFIPNEEIIPSVSVLQFFPADGGTRPILSISPGMLLPVRKEGQEENPQALSGKITPQSTSHTVVYVSKRRRRRR